MNAAEQLSLGNARLLELADYVERRQSHAPRKRYNQRIRSHKCGAPACLLGHADCLFGTEFAFFAFFWHGDFFALDAPDWADLFGSVGCNNAGRDWRKAVAYVRSFVARRRADREEATHGK